MEITSGEPYSVARDGDDIVVRMRADFFTREELSDFLDWVVLENIRRKASLSDEQIAELADEVDGAVWERLRPMVEEKLAIHARANTPA
ncbi:hypothetical protein [Longimicrobium sp.]|uniref:hypothetical protein n=1 Tax=Longimicrobium sp. TaxID=2029185 RepID=UPI002C8D7640|nr:hypothetical protein [Longimicrobium sp.]HSU14283.1 hypothetical protein [Longimicrobium sp.]